MKISHSSLGALALGFSLALVACGSSSSGSTTTNGDGGSGGGSDTTSGTQSTGSITTVGPSTGASSPTSTGSAGGTCDAPQSVDDCNSTNCADFQSCATCIGMEDAAAINSFDTILIQDCGCAAGSDCASACATGFCADNTMQPPSACISCINALASGAACLTTFQTDCKADADCLRYANEGQNCPMN